MAIIKNQLGVVPKWLIDADLSDAAFRLFARAINKPEGEIIEVDTDDPLVRELIDIEAIVLTDAGFTLSYEQP